MLASRKRLFLTGTQLCRHSRTQQCHGRLFIERCVTSNAAAIPSPSSISTSGAPDTLQSASTTTTTTVSTPPIELLRSVGNNVNPNSAKDSLCDPKVMQGAQDRWGIGSINFAPIVFPGGRPEIAEITSTLVKERISRGHTGTVSVKTSKDMRNALRDQHAKEVFDLRTLSTSISSSSSSSSPNPHLHKLPRDGSEPEIPLWRKHKEAIKKKLLGKTWNPKRKITRLAMEEVRYLRKQFPEEWTTEKLAVQYNVSGEDIAKILRTNFQPHSERAAEQDRIREQARKQNVKASLERHKAERDAELERSKLLNLREKYGDMTPAEFEELKVARHAAWLERKAAKDKKSKAAKIRYQRAGQQDGSEGEEGRIGVTDSRIKLGAPKRSIPTV